MDLVTYLILNIWKDTEKKVDYTHFNQNIQKFSILQMKKSYSLQQFSNTLAKTVISTYVFLMEEILMKWESVSFPQTKAVG